MILANEAGTTELAIRVESEDEHTDYSSDQESERYLTEVARCFVHWAQALAQLHDHFPYDTHDALRRRYALKLIDIHGDDPRVERVFDPDMQLILSTSGWVDAISLEPQKFVRRTISRLAAVLDPAYAKPNGDLKPNPCRVERALSGLAPAGYKPVRIVRGTCLRPNPEHIEIAMPHDGAPVRLLNGDCLSEDKAFDLLEQDFPGVSRQYEKAAIAAAICADSAKGPPPMVWVAGPSGAGKDQGLHLAASFLADSVQDVTFKNEAEAYWRRLAGYCKNGHRFVHVPEAARERNCLKLLLKTGNLITWRMQGGNRDLQTPNTAALFLSGISIPSDYRRSAEFRRRVRVVQLTQKVPVDWDKALAARYGQEVNSSEWRSLSDDNALIANSILTNVFRLCERHRFCFKAVADELGLLFVDEDDAEMQRELCRQLYRHCRGETGGRQIHEMPRWKTGEWVDMRAPACWSIIEQLAADEEDLALKNGRDELFYRLKSLDWPTILAIEKPPIGCETAAHGRACAIRFRDATRMKKGDGVFNEALPPIGD